MNACVEHVKGWPPGRRAHCSACHEGFTGMTAFDLHQKKYNGKCQRPDRVGLVRNEHGLWGTKSD